MSSIFKLLIDNRLIDIKDDQFIYYPLAIDASHIFYQELKKSLNRLGCNEVISNNLFNLKLNENTLYYQYNSLLDDKLFLFYGEYQNIEKTRLNVFIVMELIVEVVKRVFSIPLFSVENYEVKNEFILYTFINNTNIEVAKFKIEDGNCLKGFIDKISFLAFFVAHLNSNDKIILPCLISPHTILIDPIKPERAGIMDYARYLFSLLLKEGISSKLYEPNDLESTKGIIPFTIRVSRKEVRDKSITIIDNLSGDLTTCSEEELIVKIKGLIQNQVSLVYNRLLKTYLENVSSDLDDNMTYHMISWCGEDNCLGNIQKENSKYYLPFKQYVKSKNCIICNNKAHKNIILVKTSQ